MPISSGPVATSGTQTSVPSVKAPTGGTLSLRQLMTLAQSVGFTGDHIAEAAAIAMAESSGRSGVVNSIKCVGLWQINQPVWVKSNPSWSISYLKNPTNNANAAKKISNNGTNWKPWSTYGGNAYKKFLDQAKKLLPKLAGVAAGPITGGAVEAATGALVGGGITGAIDQFTETIRKAALSYVVLLVALVLLVLGIVILLRKPILTVASPGGKVGTALKVAKKVTG
jgi:hypothetical protein